MFNPFDDTLNESLDNTHKQTGAIDMDQLVIENVSESCDSMMKLSQSINKKDKLLRNMRHELRTPIHSLLGFVDLLGGQFFGELNKKQLHYVKQIETNTPSLLFLINNMIDILRIDLNTMEMDLNRVSMEDLINDVVSEMSNQFVEKGVTVEVRIQPELPYVMADIKKCEQIMLIILMLSLKNISDGNEIKISAHRVDASHIMVRVNQNPSLTDNDITTVENQIINKDSDSTDICISLARRLVALHGGMLGIEKKTNKENMIWFTLTQDKSGNKGVI